MFADAGPMEIGETVGDARERKARRDTRQVVRHIGIEHDLLAGVLEDLVGGVEQGAIAAGAIERKADLDPADAAQIVLRARCFRLGKRLRAKGAHLLDRIAARNAWCVRFEPGVQLLFGPMDGRADRP